jgi:Mrp family chromosome partitioning ATPase
MSKILFVGGDKGGVGKSVVARLLAQWYLDRQCPFVAIDADVSHGSLLRHYSAYTRSADLSRLEAADDIMTQALESDRRVVVDLPAQGDRAVAAWISEAGILDLARESGIDVIFWHVMDDGRDSIATLHRLLERHGRNARYVIVANMGRGTDFSLFDKSPTRALAEELGAMFMDLPELHPPAMRKIDRSDASFWAAVHNPEVAPELFTRMDRQRIKVWMQSVYDRLARLGDAL